MKIVVGSYGIFLEQRRVELVGGRLRRITATGGLFLSLFLVLFGECCLVRQYTRTLFPIAYTSVSLPPSFMVSSRLVSFCTVGAAPLVALVVT